MIVSIKGETKEECYARYSKICKGSSVCMVGCVDMGHYFNKPAASAAKSWSSFSTVADELHVADPPQ